MIYFEDIIYCASYTTIIYYAFLTIIDHGPFLLPTVVINTYNYNALTISTLLFLSIDFVYKYHNKANYKQFEYYALQCHHIISITGFIMTYLLKYSQIFIANLSLFEISSILLIFYNRKICQTITLPLLWLTFLIFRIMWGNVIIIHYLYQININDTPDNAFIYMYCIFGSCFFLVFNVYYFHKLTCIMIKRIKQRIV